jgi:hypothetical protein
MIVRISSSVIPVFAIDLVSNMYARSIRVVLSMKTTRRLLRSVLNAYGFENKSRTLSTGRSLLPSHQRLFIIMAEILRNSCAVTLLMTVMRMIVCDYQTSSRFFSMIASSRLHGHLFRFPSS